MCSALLCCVVCACVYCCAIVLTLLLVPLLPESASYLARRKSPIDLLKMTQRFFPGFLLPDGAILTSNEDQTGETKIRGLFSARLRVGTDVLELTIDLRKLHFFDLDSGATI